MQRLVREMPFHAQIAMREDIQNIIAYTYEQRSAEQIKAMADHFTFFEPEISDLLLEIPPS
jgi:hypothetical protein